MRPGLVDTHDEGKLGWCCDLRLRRLALVAGCSRSPDGFVVTLTRAYMALPVRRDFHVETCSWRKMLL